MKKQYITPQMTCYTIATHQFLCSSPNAVYNEVSNRTELAPEFFYGEDLF